MRNFTFIVTILFSFVLEAQSIRDLYQEGLKAYENKDFQLFKEKMFSIDTMRPNYPAVVYNLAGAYALTGEQKKSIETLNKYILMDASQDFTKDTDFESLSELKKFKHIIEKQEELKKEIPTDQVLTIGILASHPESITYSTAERVFFIGGVRDGNIWQVNEDGSHLLWAPSVRDSWCVMGLGISSDERYLWACTAAMENYIDFKAEDEGKSSVLKYDLKTGELLTNFTLPGGHVFGDLIIDTNGEVLISDGSANKLYTVNEKAQELEVYADLSSKVFNLQGLTLNDDETTLYVSDYIDGVYKLDRETKNLDKLKIESKEVLIKGIDGLYFSNNTLIGLHNGNTPNRVVRYQLNNQGNSITGKEVISQAGILGEPTQGVFVNGEFHYITNSPWGAYDKDGNFNPTSDQLIIGKY